MADEADRIEVQFTKTEALAQKLLDQIERDLALAEAVGNEVEIARLQAKRSAIGGPQQYARQSQEIERDSAALARENTIREQGLNVELAINKAIEERIALEREASSVYLTPERRGVSSYGELSGQSALAEIRAQEAAAAAAAEQVAATRSIVLPRPRRGGAYGDLAGQQASREAYAAEVQAERDLLTQAEAVGLELQRQQVSLGEALALEQAQNEALVQQAALRSAMLGGVGRAAYEGAASGRGLGGQGRGILALPPQGREAEHIGGRWSEAEQQLARYNVELGAYQGYASRAGLSSDALTADLTRLGMVEAEASNAMRRHGALTTEWLSALARGETTVSEFGYQLGATVGKVAGWTAATSATFGALGTVFEFGKGAIDSANGVGQLQRTINGLNTEHAAEQFRRLSQETDVSIKDASDAVFQFSRTFHNLNDAVTVARLGLAAYQLDNVQLSDSVRAVTAIHQQFGVTAHGMSGIYDMLASGQREYNARISDMIPLLQKSTGAVKNAGGDLTQLIQLSTVALRVTQQSGQQVGTAFYRAAATQVPKNAAALVTQFGLGKDINPVTGQGNFTQLLQDAIKESATLSGPRRRQLANLIFGQQYGGRLGALFGPESAQLLSKVAGSGPESITPGATRGKLNEELNTQLQQTRKELDQFVFGLQRVGSALAQTGALTPLGGLLKLAIVSLDSLTALVDIFDRMPGPLKEMLSLFVELRLAMLFFSRTRFGSSTPLITRVPGFRPSEATVARRELAIGTRSALGAVENDLAQNTSRSLQNQARIAILDRQRAALVGEAGSEEALTEEQLAKSNSITERILALQREQLGLEADRSAQLEALALLQRQQVGITASSRRVRYSDEEVLALRGAAGAGTEGADAAATGAATRSSAVGSAAMARLSAARARLSAALGREATTTRAAATADAEMAVAADENAAATRVMAERAAATNVALDAEVASTEATTGVLAGARARFAGFAAALDPLTVGLIAIPFLYEGVAGALSKQGDAMSAAQHALGRTIKSIDDLKTKADQLQKASQAQANSADPGGLTSILSHVQVGVGTVLGGSAGRALIDPFSQTAAGSRQSAAISSSLTSLDNIYKYLAKQLDSDGKRLVKTQSGRRQLAEELERIRGRYTAIVSQALSPDDFKDVVPISEAATKAFRGIVDRLTQHRGGSAGTNDFRSLVLSGQLAPKTIEQQLQAMDDASKIFGTGSDGIKKSLLGYAAIVSRFGQESSKGSLDDTTLQAIYTAQQNLVQAVQKNVQDFIDRAGTATSNSGEQADLSSALRVMDSARDQAKAAFALIFKRDKDNLAKLKADHDAYDQVMAQFATQFQTVINAQLQLMQSQSAVSVSRIQGISPESDLARQQASLNNLRRQLDFARSHGANAQTVNNLQAQVNDAQNALQKQQTSNARSIVDAQGQLAESAITGIGPQADIARAQKAIARARTLLGFDEAHGAGQAAILSDQAALDSAIHDLNAQLQQRAQQIEQDAQAFIQSQSDLQQSREINPIPQARSQLEADIKALQVVKPEDYKTYQEYQTALMEQKAKINKDTTTLRQAIVNQDMQTLQFELHTQRITDQQYVDGLQQLLKQKRLTLQQRQDIQSEIFDTLHQSAVDLNVGQIKLPTTYEVRKALQAGLRARGVGPSAQGPTVYQPVTNHNNVKIDIHVADGRHIRAVTDAIRKGLDQVGGQAQASGLI